VKEALMAAVVKKAAPKAAAKNAPKADTEKKGRPRAAKYSVDSKITVVTGDGARRVVKGLAVERAMNAIAKNNVVGKYSEEFGKELDKKPLPGRSGQPGQVQAQAILRFLEKEGAVVVK